MKTSDDFNKSSESNLYIDDEDLFTYGVDLALAEENLLLRNFEQAKLIAKEAIKIASKKSSHAVESGANVYMAFAEGILAEGLYDQGLYQESAKVFKKALERYEYAYQRSHVYSPEAIEMVGATNMIASTILNNERDYEIAVETAQLALGFSEKILHPNNTEISRALITLGKAYLFSNDTSESPEALFERAINILEEKNDVYNLFKDSMFDNAAIEEYYSGSDKTVDNKEEDLELDEGEISWDDENSFVVEQAKSKAPFVYYSEESVTDMLFDKECIPQSNDDESGTTASSTITKRPDNQASQKDIEKAEKVSEELCEAYYHLGCLYASREDYDNAITAWHKACTMELASEKLDTTIPKGAFLEPIYRLYARERLAWYFYNELHDFKTSERLCSIALFQWYERNPDEQDAASMEFLEQLLRTIRVETGRQPPPPKK